MKRLASSTPRIVLRFCRVLKVQWRSAAQTESKKWTRRAMRTTKRKPSGKSAGDENSPCSHSIARHHWVLPRTNLARTWSASNCFEHNVIFNQLALHREAEAKQDRKRARTRRNRVKTLIQGEGDTDYALEFVRAFLLPCMPKRDELLHAAAAHACKCTALARSRR